MKSIIQQLLRLSLLFAWMFCSLLHGQGISIRSGAYLKTYGSPYIVVNNGNLSNSGTWSSSGTGLTTFSGSTPVLFSGYGTTGMYDVLLSNTGGILQQIRQVDMHNLNITSNSMMTIDTAKAVIVSNIIDNQRGISGLYLRSMPEGRNATFVYHNSYSSPVNATVEMYSKAYKGTSYKWQYFGIPLRSVVASPTFDGTYVRKHNEPGWNAGYTNANLWISQINNSVITSFSGYEITMLTPKTIYFSGQLENSDYSSGQLSYTPGAQYPGQHLIGNPYTAGIDIKKIQFGSGDPAVMDNIVYIYNTGSLADWQGTGGAGTITGTSPGQYIAVPQNQAGTEGLPAQIPSMQAFLLRVNSASPTATIAIPYSSVGTALRNTEIQRIKSPEPDNEQDKVYTIVDVNGSRYSDRMWIFSEKNCTRSYNNGWDGYKILGSSLVPQIWSIEKDGNYQVNSLDEIDSTIIGFKKGEDSIYTLTFKHNNSTLKYPSLYLADFLTGSLSDVSEDNSKVTFKSTSVPTDYARFVLLRSKGVITKESNDHAQTPEMDIIAFKQNIFVRNNTGGTLTFSGYNSDGKAVYTQTIKDQGLIKLNNTFSGICIAQLKNNKKTLSRTFVLAN